MAALGDFIKQNISENTKGMMGAFTGLAAIQTLSSEQNKFKAILQIIRDITLATVLWEAAQAKLFSSMSKGIRTLLKDTGSLEAALQRLKQVQGLEKVFTPFVGGANAAKLKVAELVNFAANKNLRLDNVAAGALALEQMTRGGYSGAQALATVADAAAGTGTNFTSMASAVGEFSDTLRSGGSITGISEQLRQMGAISQATASKLEMMQEAGASNGEMMSTLTSSLDAFKGAAEAAKESLDGVEAAHAAAAAQLQVAFGSPFKEADIQNTKNWTEVMKNLAPVVSTVANFFQTLTGGFRTATSAIAKMITGSETFRGVLGGLIMSLGLLVTAVSAVAGVNLVGWLLKASAAVLSATGAFGGLALAIRGIAAALLGISGIGLIIALVATAAGMVYNFVKSGEAATKALNDLRNAHDQAADAIERQANGIRTLTDLHDTLAAALIRVGKAQDEVWNGTKEQEGENLRNLKRAKEGVEKLKKTDTSKLAPTTEEHAETEGLVRKGRMLNEQKFQEAIEKSAPENRSKLYTERMVETRSRAEQAQIGVGVAADYSRDKQTSDLRVSSAQLEYENAKNNRIQHEQTGRGTGDFRGEENKAAKELRAARQEQGNIGLNAPEGSSVHAEAQQRKATEEGRMQDAEHWKVYAETRKQEEQNAPQLAVETEELALKADMARREQEMIDIRVSAEEKIGALKSRGIEHSQEEWGITKERLNAELAVAQKHGDKTAARSINTQLQAGEIALKQQGSEARLSEVELEATEKISGLHEKGPRLALHEYQITRDKLQHEANELRSQGTAQGEREARAKDAEIDRLDISRASQKANEYAAHAELQAHEQMSSSRLRGFSKSEEDYRIQQDMLAKQALAARTAGYHEKARAINAQAAQSTQEQILKREGMAATGIGIGISAARSNAMVHGDSRRIKQLDDFSVAKEKYDELIGQGIEKGSALKLANQFGANAISLDARNTNAVVGGVSSMARIGGGGGVEATRRDSTLSVAQRQLAVQEEMKQYLATLAGFGQTGQTMQ